MATEKAKMINTDKLVMGFICLSFWSIGVWFKYGLAGVGEMLENPGEKITKEFFYVTIGVWVLSAVFIVPVLAQRRWFRMLVMGVLFALGLSLLLEPGNNANSKLLSRVIGIPLCIGTGLKLIKDAIGYLKASDPQEDIQTDPQG